MSGERGIIFFVVKSTAVNNRDIFWTDSSVGRATDS